MELVNPCSNLPLLKVDSCVPMFHLTCAFQVFLVKCCNGFSLKPKRSMCDIRPFASPLFRRLAGRGAFFRGFPFRWVLHFALFLTRSISVHAATPYSREDPLYECGRPCDNLSCLFFTALWPRQSQSILVREIQRAKDIDLTCFKAFPIKATTCLQVELTSLEWPVDPIARSDQSSPSSSHEDPKDEHPEGALPASSHSRWRRDALHPPHAQHDTAGRDTCGPFLSEGLRCITWNTRGRFFPRRKTGSSSSNISGSSLTLTTSSVSRWCTEKMSTSKLSRSWLRDLGFSVPSFMETRMQGDRPHASTRIFCLRMLLWHTWLLAKAVTVLWTYSLGRQI